MALNAAQQLSQWIEQTHPGLFDVVYGHVQRRAAVGRLQRSRLRGFGDDGDFTLDPSVVDFSDVLQQTAVQPLDLSNDIAPAFADTDFISSQYTPAEVDIPTLTSTDLQAPGSTGTVNASFTASSDSGAMDAQTDQGGGNFLQSIGSGIASAAVSVGHFLTSPAGMQTVGGLANAYFALENNKVNAQIQQQVLTAQIAKASVGAAPMPITYTRAANGQLIPVYASSPMSSAGVYPSNMPPELQQAIASGQAQLVELPDGTTGYTIPPSVLPNLSGSVTMSGALPWIILFGLGLVILSGKRGL